MPTRRDAVAAVSSGMYRCLEGFGMSKVQVVSELWQFMRENKKYWLAPIVITLVLVGALLVLAKSSAIAPFIYTLF
jgi:uncharacterized protein DUF5989